MEIDQDGVVGMDVDPCGTGCRVKNARNLSYPFEI